MNQPAPANWAVDIPEPKRDRRRHVLTDAEFTLAGLGLSQSSWAIQASSTTRAGYRALPAWMRTFGDVRRIGIWLSPKQQRSAVPLTNKSYYTPDSDRRRRCTALDRLIAHAQRRHLRIDRTWLWAAAFTTCWQRLTELPALT